MTHSHKRTSKHPDESAPKRLQVDADGIYESGKPLRAAQPWNWSKRILANGRTAVGLVPPASGDTVTTVLHEAALLEPELRLAAAALRAGEIESPLDIRKAFPEVDKRCSDSHLEALSDNPEREIRNIRKFMARIFADASGYLDEDSVYRYLKFKGSRQIKKATAGRPRK